MMQERKKHMFLSISIIILSISIKTKYVLPSKNKNNQKIGMMVQREKMMVKLKKMMEQRKKMMLEQYTHFWGTSITSLYELHEKTYSNSSVPDTLNGTDPVLDRYRSGT